MNDIWVLNRGHDLDFPSNSHQICLCLDLRLFDGFDGNLLASLFVDTKLNLAIRTLTQLAPDLESVFQFSFCIRHSQLYIHFTKLIFLGEYPHN